MSRHILGNNCYAQRKDTFTSKINQSLVATTMVANELCYGGAMVVDVLPWLFLAIFVMRCLCNQWEISPIKSCKLKVKIQGCDWGLMVSRAREYNACPEKNGLLALQYPPPTRNALTRDMCNPYMLIRKIKIISQHRSFWKGILESQNPNLEEVGSTLIWIKSG